MSENPDIEPTEENLKMALFMKEFLTLLQKYGLTPEDDDSEVPHERAANVLVTEVHDWYRSGRMGVDAASFSEYCEAVQEANYKADDLNGEFSADN